MVCLLVAAPGLEARNVTEDIPNDIPERPCGPPWYSPSGRDHPLAGRIWHPAEGRFTTPDSLVKALDGASFVLLGEKHDNIDHHRIQAWLVNTVFERGQRMAVAFEIFDTDQAEALQAYLATGTRDASGIASAVNWQETGWPAWAMYQPIAQAALNAEAPILAASLPRRTAKAMVSQGLDVLGKEKVARLGLDRPLPEDKAEVLRKMIVRSHCNMLPDHVAEGMVSVQFAKDAQMADVMVQAAEVVERDGVILIAGGEHVRGDLSVPFHLRRMAPGRAVTTVGMIEVIAEMTEPEAYVAAMGSDSPLFDFLWFTPRVDEEDPCVKYAEQLKRMREHHEEMEKGKQKEQEE